MAQYLITPMSDEHPSDGDRSANSDTLGDVIADMIDTRGGHVVLEVSEVRSSAFA